MLKLEALIGQILQAERKMSSVPAIQIVLARQNKQDDIIRILPMGGGQDWFSVTYDDRWSGYKFYFEDTWEEVSAYLSQIFAVLPVDREPYEGVQVSVPAYPSIWINTNDTTDLAIMDPIWTMLDAVAHGWPVRLVSKSQNTDDSSSTSYSESDSGSESDYDV